jgi:hypothetical protein
MENNELIIVEKTVKLIKKLKAVKFSNSIFVKKC